MTDGGARSPTTERSGKMRWKGAAVSRSRSASRHEKQLGQAAALKRVVSKDSLILAVATCVCVVAIFAYSSLVFAGVLEDDPAAQGVAIIAAIIVGTISLRRSKHLREFRDFVQAHGLSEEEVKEHMRFARVS